MMQRSILVVLPVLVLAALWGCDNDTSNDVSGTAPGGTCLGCHSSEDNLKAALGGKEDVVIRVGLKDDG